MVETASPDVVVYVCHNAIPAGGDLAHQWEQDGAHVESHRVPCSGKIDIQYLMHAFEGGGYGVCLVTCPRGECHLSQGNYRAEIRIRTVKRLLAEIGLEPERAELLRSSQEDSPDQLDQTLRDAVQRLCKLGKSPLRTEGKNESSFAEVSEGKQ